jgi:hypothetical protein
MYFLNLFEFAGHEDMQPGAWMGFREVRILPSSGAVMPAPYRLDKVWELARFDFNRLEDNLVLFDRGRGAVVLTVKAFI